MTKNSKKLAKEITKLKNQLQKEQSLPNYMNLIEKLMDLNELEDALIAVDEAIEKYKTHQTLFIAKAKILFELQDYMKADAILKEILQDNPENLIAKRILDKIKCHSDKTNEADEDTENVCIEDGLKALKIGNTELALSIFKKILEENPEDTFAKEGFMKAYAATVEIEKRNGDQDIDEVDKRSAVVLKTIEILEYWQKANRLKQKQVNHKLKDEI